MRREIYDAHSQSSLHRWSIIHEPWQKEFSLEIHQIPSSPSKSEFEEILKLIQLKLIERKSEANEARATLTHQWSRERVKKADEHVRSEQDRADN